MIKYAALISLLVIMCEGQRPPYAGSANRYPQVLPRFQEEQDRAAAAAAATATPSTQGTTAAVGNRVGEGTANSAGSVAPAAGGSTTTLTSTVAPTTSELPVLALGQGDFVDRIKTWPEDQRPFWYTNRQQVAAHLNPGVNQENTPRPFVGSRGSFFAGK